MIVKELEPPEIIFKLEALLKRLSKYYIGRHEIEIQLARYRAGYNGEMSLAYYLKQLSVKEYIILHDLRLCHQSTCFQMDTVILHKNFILILEVKNISGDIYIDTTYNQMIRTLNGTTEVFPDPILQSSNQRKNLERWLIENKCPAIPIENLVVFTNTNTYIKNSPQDKSVFQRLVRSPKLLFFIENYTKSYQTPIFTPKQLSKWSNFLLKNHSPKSYNVLKQFNVPQTEILTGVYCAHCQHVSMERISGTWRCMSCLSIQKDAHISALRDYAYLNTPFITNREARKFLKIESISVTRKLLQNLNLPSTGTTKDRTYDLTPLIKTPPSPPDKPAPLSSKKHNSRLPHIHKKIP